MAAFQKALMKPSGESRSTETPSNTSASPRNSTQIETPPLTSLDKLRNIRSKERTEQAADSGIDRCSDRDTSRSRDSSSDRSSSNKSNKSGTPRFISPLKDQQVSLGDMVTLSVTVEGEPLPDIMWLKSGVELTSNRRYTLDTNTSSGVSSLTIRRFRAFDKGAYVCSASNKCGQVETTCDISSSSTYFG